MKIFTTLNEYLDSLSLLRVKHFAEKLKIIFKRKNINIINIEQEEHNIYLEFEDKNLNQELITNTINLYRKDLLEKENILLTIYDINKYSYSIIYNIYFKNIRLFRVKPNRFIYHQTNKENVDKILKEGLIPRDASKWLEEDKTLNYPPAIFMSNGDKFFYNDIDIVTLQIDTTKITNKWFTDMNMTYGLKAKKSKYIMTFDPIPPEAIKIFDPN